MRRFLLTSIATFAFALTGLCSVTIAVLPYSVTYRGNIPKKMTEEKIEEGRRLDSENYQTAMIEQLTRMAKKKKYVFLDINVIGQRQIDAMLFKSGIDTLVNSLSNAEIAEILGVTHVLRGSVDQIFIMSDGAAMGVGAIGILTGNGGSTATSSLNIRNALENLETNELTYSQQALRTTKVTRPAARALRSTFRQSSRRMLRRIKKGES